MKFFNYPTSRRSVVALSLGAILLGGLAGGLTRPLPALAASPGDVSGPCGDPFVNAAYHQIAGRAPYGSGKNVGECNIYLYGGGHWSSYDDLVNKAKTYLRIEGELNVASLVVFGRLPDDATLTTYGQQPERNVATYISYLKAAAFSSTAERQATINRAYLAATGRGAAGNDYNYYLNKRDDPMYIDMVRDITNNLWSEPNNESSEKVQVIRRAYAAAGLSPSNSDIYGVFNIGGWVHGPAKSYVMQVVENKKWAAQHTSHSVSTAAYIPLPNALAAQLSAALGSQAGVVSQGGGNVVSQGGGNVVSQGGGNVVSQGGGNVVSQGGGNVVSQGGGNVVSQGGGNLIAPGAF